MTKQPTVSASPTLRRTKRGTLQLLFVPLVALAFAADSVSAATQGPPPGLNSLLRWNKIAIGASALDHTPPAIGETRTTFREQMGPGRASRALAIVHISMFDAVNATANAYNSYTGVRARAGALSIDAAIGQAAHDTLVALYPAQSTSLDALLATDLGRIKNGIAKANGIDLGKRAASAILSLRANDGSAHPEVFIGVDYTTSDLPGHWRMDPISQIPIALGVHWGECAPFVVASSSQFRVPPPPAMTSPEYAAAYDEVKRLGGDGVVTPTERTPEQTIIGTFWGYDGTPYLGTPPNLFNQILVHISRQMGSDTIQTARLLALANMAMSDATLTVWESKYYYDVWRPITGVREGDTDGNSDTAADPAYTPLGAPASNGGGLDFTPPFPAYPSGHAGMGGAVFETLRRFYGTDNIPFTFVSDELNGITRDSHGNVRPLVPRSFSTLSQAEEENGQSRIYLGIHWQFDKASIGLGRNVADYIFERALTPLPPRVR
jgi:hypothetical protein